MPVIRPPSSPLTGAPIAPEDLQGAAMDLMGPGVAMGQIIPSTGRIAKLLYELVSSNPKAKQLIQWLHQRPEPYEVIERKLGGDAAADYTPFFHLERTPQGQLPVVPSGGGRIRMDPQLTSYHAPRALTHELGHAYDLTRHGLYPLDPSVTLASSSQPIRAANWLRRINPEMANDIALERPWQPYSLSPEAMARFQTDFVFGGRTGHGSLWPDEFGQPPIFSDVPQPWTYAPPPRRPLP